MTRFKVDWRGGLWSIETPDGEQHPLTENAQALDAWLAEHGELTRRELDFGGSRALEQKFIHDFGPITGRRPGGPPMPPSGDPV